MIDSLGDRMKKYEKDFRTKLPDNFPVVMRIDGKAFHTWTQGCKKPFDEGLIDAMNACAIELCKEIQGAQVAFVQSDEISIFIHSYKRFDSQAWFGNQVQKMCSVAAATASTAMSERSTDLFGAYKRALFDCRVFIVPEADLVNYFLWRQQDWTRNSIQMLARSYYSDKQLHGKKRADMQDMIHAKGNNWNNLATYLKRGRCIVKETYQLSSGEIDPHRDSAYEGYGPDSNVTRSRWVVDDEIPIFSKDRDYIGQHLEKEEG
jgi:tRNA(His) 5'-end guanylyltransferase